jgi:3-dehydroquinate dehydratase II
MDVPKAVLVLNGPNLNLLGTREPDVYGHDTLADIERKLAPVAQSLGVGCTWFQSNHEGALIDRIHSARTDGTQFAVINPGGLTHTSVSLRDAFSGVNLPFVEVHLSNIHRRESFRHKSLLADVAVGTVVGLGSFGYEAALRYAASYLATATNISTQSKPN